MMESTLTKEVLARLQGVRKSGAGWSARCPLHDDKTPSLSIVEKDGDPKLTCHRGCNWKELRAAVGLDREQGTAHYMPASEESFTVMSMRAARTCMMSFAAIWWMVLCTPIRETVWANP